MLGMARTAKAGGLQDEMPEGPESSTYVCVHVCVLCYSMCVVRATAREKQRGLEKKRARAKERKREKEGEREIEGERG
jgi:hypothetical protein